MIIFYPEGVRFYNFQDYLSNKLWMEGWVENELTIRCGAVRCVLLRGFMLRCPTLLDT